MASMYKPEGFLIDKQIWLGESRCGDDRLGAWYEAAKRRMSSSGAGKVYALISCSFLVMHYCLER